MTDDLTLRKHRDRLTNLLLEQSKLIATAESCTGGMLASLFTDLAGSSKWFERGFVTYSNLAKEQMLNVPASLIEQHGAVSIEVAAAMAQGALYNSKADLAIAITGIAGPDGGSREKPVGTICFGFANRDSLLLSERQQFSQLLSRSQIRQLSCRHAIVRLIALLSEV